MYLEVKTLYEQEGTAGTIDKQSDKRNKEIMIKSKTDEGYGGKLGRRR